MPSLSFTLCKNIPEDLKKWPHKIKDRKSVQVGPTGLKMKEVYAAVGHVRVETSRHAQVQTEAERDNLNKKEKHLILPCVQVNCMIIFSCHRSSIQVDTFVHFKLTLYIHHLTFSLSTQLIFPRTCFID